MAPLNVRDSAHERHEEFGEALRQFRETENAAHNDGISGGPFKSSLDDDIPDGTSDPSSESTWKSEAPTPYHYKGGEPSTKHLSRTLEVKREAWLRYLRKTKSRRGSGVYTSVFDAPDKPESSVAKHCGSGGELFDGEKRHRTIFGFPTISPYSTLATGWSLFMLLFDAFYTAFAVPIIIAFVLKDREDGGSILASIIEISAGAIFTVDIVLNFSIGFIVSHDYKKKLVMDGKSIACYYLKHGGAWIDFLAVTPFLYEVLIRSAGVEDKSLDQVLTILRLVRLLRLWRFMKMLFTSSVSGASTPFFGQLSPSLAYFGNVMYTIAVMVNFLGCLLYVTARWEGLADSWVADSGHLEDTLARQYLTSIYWATVTITTVGYGEIVPVTAIETIVVLILMITHIFLFGLLVGSMTELLKNASKNTRRAERLRSKLLQVNSWLKVRRMKPDKKKKVHAYYTQVWSRREEFDEASLLLDLPVLLRSEIVYSMLGETLRKLDIFRSMDEDMRRLICGRLTPQTVPPGHEICKEGDPADSIYIILEGAVVSLIGDVELETVVGPATAGESNVLSIISNGFGRESTTLRSISSCDLWKLPLEDLELLLESMPELKLDLVAGCKERTKQKLRSTKSNALSWTSRSISNITQRFEKHLVEFDACVTRELQLPSRDSMSLSDTSGRTDSGELRSKKSSPPSLNTVLEKPFEDAVKDALNALKAELKMAGVHGLLRFVHEMRARLQFGDENFLTVEDFAKAMSSFKMDNTSMALLCRKYNKGDGGMNWELLVSDLRGDGLSSVRSSLVERLYLRLSGTTCSIHVGDLPRLFWAHAHPDVQEGKSDSATVVCEFLKTFEGREAVTLTQFLSYFEFVSACVDGDSDFGRFTAGVFQQAE